MCLALLAVAIAPAMGQEKFDPAARAKVVAPFIDDQTVAVLHVDTSRMPVDALFAKAFGLLPELEQGLGEVRKAVNGWLKDLEPVAAKDIYVVVSMADAGGSWYWYAPRISLVALKPTADEKVIAKLFDEPGVAKKRVGDFLLIAPSETMKRLATLKPEPHPEVEAAFAAAGDTGGQVLVFVPAYARRVIEEMMPELPKQVGGGPSTLVTHGVRWVAIAGDIAPQLSGRLVIQSQDAAAAAALHARIVECIRGAGKMSVVRRFVAQYDKLAAVLTPKLVGDQMTVTLDAATVDSVLNAVLKPALGAAERASQRTQSVNQLKQIALAMHSYYDVHKSFPPAFTVDKQGKALLSWRVLILPYLDQSALYRQFRLNEPWDSPHNRKLAETVVSVYRSPLSKAAVKDPWKTNYLLPIGPGTAFGGKEPPKFSDMKDGTSNTIMVVEADDDHAVIWSKPGDLPYDPKEPLKGLGGLMQNGFHAVYFDGSVRYILKTADPKALRAAFSAAAGDGPGP